MKKLLVLMLVLGMASAANASVLTWSVDAITLTLGSDAVVQISSDDDQFYTKYAGNSSSSVADITGIAARGTNAGDNPAVVESPSGWGPDWWKIEAKDGSPPSDVIAGIHWDVTLHPLATGTYEAYSDYYGTNDMLEITVVPEPATVVLLGLGSLFLLRRRK